MKFLCIIFALTFYAWAGLDVSSFEAYVDSMVPGSRFGISVRSVKSGVELANINGNEKFTPASTLKTLTTAAALHFLPLNYSPKTEVSLNGSILKNAFYGIVTIRGEGDPNFSARYYADPFYMLYAMTDSIHSLGIDSLFARIDLDTSFYKGPWKAADWRKNFYDAWYGAEIAPLGFNDNCTLVRFKPGKNIGDTAIVEILPDVGYVKVINNMVTVPGKKRKWTWSLDAKEPIITIGGTIGINVDSSQLVLPVRNPVAYFNDAFKHALNERGIVFVNDFNIKPGIRIAAFTFSAAPLLSLLDEINQRSQNLHAETLFRNMGAIVYGEGSTLGGRKANLKFLSEIGIDSADFEIYDGCGLSPKNKVKPSVETILLAKMARHSKGKYYINSFASPGVGTGGKRMLNLPYPWLTNFKSGFIGEVHALVGYVYPIDGDTLSVAMYLNETGKNSDAKLKDVLDTLWLKIVSQTNDNYASLIKMKRMWLDARSILGFSERLNYFSKILLDTPYNLGATGESYLDSVDAKPLINIDSLDCVTYLEHVLAMSIAKNENEIFSILQKIRYKNGAINFVNRKHYLIADFVNEGIFAKIMRLPGDTIVERTMAKKTLFASKKIKYDKNDSPIKFSYLPYNRAVEMAAKPYDGPFLVTGIAFVAKQNNLDVTHTGFVIFSSNNLPVLRHAAYKKQVQEILLKDYLNSRKNNLPGVIFFEFKRPK